MKKLLLLMFCMILLVGTVSAGLDYDNVKQYDSKVGDYGIIEIKNSLFGIEWLQLGKVASVELKTNTESCLPTGCEAVKEIIMYEDGELIDDIRFIDKKINQRTEIINYKLEVKNKDGKWIEYNYEEVEGNNDGILYEVRLIGQVYPFQSVDWQISSQGLWLDEYADWTDDLNTNLMGYWSLDESTGQDFVDNVTGTYNATGEAIINAGGRGILGNGVFFNGTEFAKVNVSTITRPDNLTLSFWVNTNITAGTEYIFGAADGGEGTNSFVIRKEANNTIVAGVYVGTTAYLAWTIGSIRDNTWTHLAMTFNNSQLTLYIDGVQNVTNYGMTGDIDAGTGFAIGSDSIHHFGAASVFNGSIDEVGIWNQSLSAAQVLVLNGTGADNPPAYDIVSTATVVNTLNLPADTTTQTNQTVNFSSNYVVSPATPDDGTIFQNSTLEVWFSNGTLHQTLFNDTYLVSNHTNFTIENLAFASYIWNINISLNNSANDFGINRTLTMSRFTELLHTYNTTVFETSRQEFQVDVETITGIQSVSAFLNYNATTYAADTTCSGTICNLTATIDIPLNYKDLTYENKTFFWQITYFLGSSTETANTTSKQQNITSVNLEECGTFLPATKRSINFTTHEETDQSSLNTDFNAFFQYYLGTGSVKKDGNSTGTGASIYDFCIDQNETFKVNSQIDLAATSFDSRHFNFIEELYTNTTRIQKLYLLNTTGSSNIIIEVKNQGLVPMKDILVNISRFYPGLGKYLTVEHQVTDEFGQIAAKLVENDVKYKFVFSNTENTVLKTSEIVSIVCRAVFCIVPFVIEDTEDQFERFENISAYTYTLLFDTTTNIFTYSWNDQRGEATRTNLQVTRIQLNGSSLVCNTTSTSTLSSLSCDVGASSASYKAQVFRTADGSTIRVDVLNIKVGDPADTYGLEGLLWVFILLFTMLGVGAYNPTIAMVLFGTGFIIMGVLGVVSFPLPVFFAVTLIVILFIWSINKR